MFTLLYARMRQSANIRWAFCNAALFPDAVDASTNQTGAPKEKMDSTSYIIVFRPLTCRF